MALIEVDNVTKVYPDGTEAVRGVSFEVTRGEFVAIMGPSGSGKSTLLHILGFLDRHTEGRYTFNEKQFDEYGASQIAHVRNREMGFVFQMFNLLPNVSVVENVILPLYYSEVPPRQWQRRAREVLDRVGLSHRLEHTPKMLSGGEKQRVAIARALVTDPDVVFADEPTGNLDTKAGTAIMTMLQELHDEGRTILVITHEDDIAKHSKRLLYIRDGLLERDEPIHEDERIILTRT